jgi:hypothetical protein
VIGRAIGNGPPNCTGFGPEPDRSHGRLLVLGVIPSCTKVSLGGHPKTLTSPSREIKASRFRRFSEDIVLAATYADLH